MNKKIKNKKFNVWKIENLFYLKSNLSRILKIVCHYEIFKITKNVKGDILEFGVFKGNSLIRLISFRNLFKLKRKKVYGFDVFGSFPKQKIKEDNAFAKKHDLLIGKGYPITFLKKSLTYFFDYDLACRQLIILCWDLDNLYLYLIYLWMNYSNTS